MRTYLTTQEASLGTTTNYQTEGAASSARGSQSSSAIGADTQTASATGTSSSTSEDTSTNTNFSSTDSHSNFPAWSQSGIHSSSDYSSYGDFVSSNQSWTSESWTVYETSSSEGSTSISGSDETTWETSYSLTTESHSLVTEELLSLIGFNLTTYNVGTSTWTTQTEISDTYSDTFSTDAWTYTFAATVTDTTTQSSTTTGNFISNTDASGTSSGRTYNYFSTASDNGTAGVTSATELSVLTRLTTISGSTSEDVSIGAPINFHLTSSASFQQSISDSQNESNVTISSTNRSGTTYWVSSFSTNTATTYYSNTLHENYTENGTIGTSSVSGSSSSSLSTNNTPPGTTSASTTFSQSTSFSVGSAATTGNTTDTSTNTVSSTWTETSATTQTVSTTWYGSTTTVGPATSSTTVTTSTLVLGSSTYTRTTSSVSSATYVTSTNSYKLGSTVSYNNATVHKTARIYERDFWERLFTLTSSASSGLLTKFLSEGSPITWIAARTNIPAASASGTYTNVSGDPGTTASGSTGVSTIAGANTMALGTTTDGTWLSSLHSLSTITVSTVATAADPAVGRQQGAFAFTTTQLASP